MANYELIDCVTSCCLNLDRAKNSFQRAMLTSVFDEKADTSAVLAESMSKYLHAVFEEMDALYQTLQEDQRQ